MPPGALMTAHQGLFRLPCFSLAKTKADFAILECSMFVMKGSRLVGLSVGCSEKETAVDEDCAGGSGFGAASDGCFLNEGGGAGGAADGNEDLLGHVLLRAGDDLGGAFEDADNARDATSKTAGRDGITEVGDGVDEVVDEAGVNRDAG